MVGHAAVFLLGVLSFACLALSMARHQQDVFGAELRPAITRALSLCGWLLQAFALYLAGQALGWSQGLVAYSGHASLAAGVVFVLLMLWQRYKLRRVDLKRRQTTGL